MSAADPLRVAVIGTGHLGKEHARVYANSDAADLVAVCDSIAQTAETIAEKWSTRPLTDYRELSNVDAVSVCVPTVDHFEITKYFLEKGVHVLVEKPMTKTLSEADALLRAAEDAGVKLQVGHIERFNPALMAAMPHIREPRFIESYRISPFSFRSSDIGVVLDLMIHDLDIILFLVNSPIRSIGAIGIPVFGRQEDVANARIEFENGCVANLTASRVSLKRERKIRGFFGNSYVSLDYDKQRGVIYRKKDALAKGEISVSDIDLSNNQNIATLAFDKFIDIQEIAMDEFEPLQRELESFLDCIRKDTDPIVSGRHGRDAIAAATEIIGQIESRMADASRKQPSQPS